MRASHSKTAFTLVELLVVIAIIAILAAILFPVFAKAREKARQAGCTSNLKQIGLAVMQYVQDYDETYPIWHWGPIYNGKYWNETGYGHQSYLEPYLKSKQVRRCVSTEIGFGTNQKWVSNQFPWCLIGIVRSGFTDTPGAKLAAVRAPANVVYCFDYVYTPYIDAAPIQAVALPDDEVEMRSAINRPSPTPPSALPRPLATPSPAY